MYLDVYKNGELVETIGLSASKRQYMVGRQEGVADILLTHSSISREQATITVSASGSVVVTDLGSAQGTYISGKALAPKKRHALAPGRSLVFGKSTRIFKLREGGDGFVAAGGARAAPAPALNKEPFTEAVLKLLRGEATLSRAQLAAGARPLRLRPDGFARLGELAASPVLAPFHNSVAGLRELASAPSRRSIFEVRIDQAEGVEVVRACAGHAPAAKVDPSLVLRPFDLASLPAGTELYHGTSFGEWNGLRARGVGAAAAAGPIRLCTVAPAKHNRFRLAGAPGDTRCDLVVVLAAAQMAAEGVEVWVDVGGSDAAAEAAVTAAVTEEAYAAHFAAPPPLALVALSAVGEAGVLGVHLFERVTNARDASEMLSPAEVEPFRRLRLLRKEKEAAAAAAEAGQKRAAEEARALAARGGEEGEEEEEQAPERYNPYLAHLNLSKRPRDDEY